MAAAQACRQSPSYFPRFFWGWLWGPVGLIISTPLTLCFVVLGRHVEQLEFLNILLGDRPALTKIENFYQRALAGDVEEVQEHAEELLEEIDLVSYYDEVAMPGLELAARDIARGVLTRAQMERIKETVIALVPELEDHVDEKQATNVEKSPTAPQIDEELRTSVENPETPTLPSKQSKAQLRCIAARNPLDEASATMLAQLLRSHGLAAQVVSKETVSRTGIGPFESDCVVVICICFIDASGSTSALRFLVRRLRQRLPSARLLIVAWPKDHPLLSDKPLKENLRDAGYASSLRDAVKFCLSVTAKPSDSTNAPTPGMENTQTGGGTFTPAVSR
jgi:hypothetical protein